MANDGVEGKVKVMCPYCEVPQWAVPLSDGRYEIELHHEPNDTPPCLGNGAKVEANALVKKDKQPSVADYFRQWVGTG